MSEGQFYKMHALVRDHTKSMCRAIQAVERAVHDSYLVAVGRRQILDRQFGLVKYGTGVPAVIPPILVIGYKERSGGSLHYHVDVVEPEFSKEQFKALLQGGQIKSLPNGERVTIESDPLGSVTFALNAVLELKIQEMNERIRKYGVLWDSDVRVCSSCGCFGVCEPVPTTQKNDGLPLYKQWRYVEYRNQLFVSSRYPQWNCSVCLENRHKQSVMAMLPPPSSSPKKERAKMSPRLRMTVFERDQFRCVICGSCASDGAKLEVDHIFPVSKGGKTEIANLQTLCDVCNRGKSNRLAFINRQQGA